MPYFEYPNGQRMDLSFIQPIIDWLNQHQEWVAASIAIIAFLESLAIAGIIIPGVLLLFAVAAIAGNGALDLHYALASAFIGAVTGDVVSFFIGKHFHQQLKSWWPFKDHPEWIRRGEDFFHRHGSVSVVLGRFIGPIRPVVPVVAGMLDMSAIKFIAINLISALAWAPVYILPGYLVGVSINEASIGEPSITQSVINGLLLLAGLIISLGITTHFVSSLNAGSKLYQYCDSKLSKLCPSILLHLSMNKEKKLDVNSLLALIASGLLFLILTLITFVTEYFFGINQTMADIASSVTTPLLNRLFIAVTLAGNSTALLLASLVITVTLLINKHYRLALISMLTGLATTTIIGLIKQGMHISRPIAAQGNTALELIENWSYPSGHTTGAIALFGIISVLIASRLKNNQRWISFCIAGAAGLSIGLSRVYLGVHWFSDILAGILLGIIICVLFNLVYQKIIREQISLNTLTQILIGTSITMATYIWLNFDDAIIAYGHPLL